MNYRGRVKDGVIVMDTPADLPEGATVRVEVVRAGAEESVDPLFRMFDLAVDLGVPDLAKNHDHYLYGLPKVEEEEAEGNE